MPKSSDRSLGSFSLDPNLLHYNQISITGSFSSTPNMLREAAKLASNNEIDLSKILSHRYPLCDINEAMLATERVPWIKGHNKQILRTSQKEWESS